MKWITPISSAAGAKHSPSIIFVIILHLAVGYALVTGLARKVVDVIKQPLETKIIEEVKKVIPDTPPPPPPKLATPPPPFIPPPEVNIQVPVTIQPAPDDHHDAPRRAAARARRRSCAPEQAAAGRCASNVHARRAASMPVFPRDAIKKGIERGERRRPRLRRSPDGSVTEVRIIQREPAAHLRPRGDPRALAVALRPGARGLHRRVEIEFKLTD